MLHFQLFTQPLIKVPFRVFRVVSTSVQDAALAVADADGGENVTAINKGKKIREAFVTRDSLILDSVATINNYFKLNSQNQ